MTDHEVRINTYTTGRDRRVRAVCSCGWKSEWETLTTPAQRAADEHLHKQLDRVHEEVEWLTEMFESEGAEWGDRLAEAEGELARLHNRLGRSEDAS